MKTTFVLVFSVLLLASISGCGRHNGSGRNKVSGGIDVNPAAAAFKESIDAKNEMVDILNGVTDDQSAETALPKLKVAAKRCKSALDSPAWVNAQVHGSNRGRDYMDTMKKYGDANRDVAFKMMVALSNAKTAAPGKSKEIMEVVQSSAGTR